MREEKPKAQSPPKLFNETLEQTVLGQLISFPEKCSPRQLKEEFFFIQQHREIFRAIQKLSETDKLVDLISIDQEMTLQKTNIENVTFSYLVQLCNFTFVPSDFKFNIQRLIEWHRKRNISLKLAQANSILGIGQKVDDLIEEIYRLKKENDQNEAFDFENRDYKFRESKVIVSPWLQSSSYNLIVGQRGIGKTLIAFELAASIAYGREFWKWQTSPSGVLYVDGELSQETFRDRLHVLYRRFPKEDHKPLKFLSLATMKVPDLSTIEGQNKLDSFISDEIDVIILDSLSTLTRCGNENEAESWQIVQDWIIDWRAKGKCIIVLHHTNKLGLQRGTSKKEDTPDVILNLTIPDHYNEENGLKIVGKFVKTRNIKRSLVPQFEVSYENINGQDDWYIDKFSKAPDVSMNTKIFQMHQEGIPMKLIAERLNISYDKIKRIISKESVI